MPYLKGSSIGTCTMPSSSTIILCSSWRKRQKENVKHWSCSSGSGGNLKWPQATSGRLRCAPLPHLFRRILQLLLLPLRHQVVQPTQLSLAEDEVQQLTDKHQGQDLQQQKQASTAIGIHEYKQRVQHSLRFTIMGKTMAALEVLMTHSRTRQLSWMMVKRCTFLRGTWRR